jgi:hypothetical protein
MQTDILRTRLAAVAIAAGFAGWALYRNDGAPVFPLDDAYIHLQYARGWAQGHPLVYQPGESPGTGATSMLWPLLLAPVAALGPEPLWPAWLWGVALGIFGFVLTADGTYRFLRAEDPADGRRARAGAVFVLGFGPLVWTAVSGMEGSLAAGSLAQTLASLRAGPWAPVGVGSQGGVTPSARRIPAWAWAVVLAMLRPEGAFLVGLIAVSEAVRVHRASGFGSLRALWVWVVPLTFGALQPVVNLVLTGRLMGTSGLSKISRATGGQDTFPIWVLWHDLILGGWGEVLAQGFGRVLPLVLALGLARAMRRDRGMVLVTCLMLPMLLLAVSMPVMWHYFRYLHPLTPVAALLAADVVGWLLGRCGELARPVGVVLGVAWGLGGASWADLLARNVSDIRVQHVEMGRWIARHLPVDARIAAGDVGALAWFGGRRLIDLEGIVTPGMQRHASAGEGSLYARLRELRPTHAVYYADTWYPGIALSGVFQEERRAVLNVRSIAGGQAMVLGATNHAVFDSAASPPHMGSGERWCAVVDVAALDSEAAAGWKEVPGTRPRAAPARFVPSRVVSMMATHGDARIVDDARHVFGTEVFRLPCVDVRGGRLVGRVFHQDAPATLSVSIGGERVGSIALATNAGRWTEVSLQLPDAYDGDEVTVVPEDSTPGDQGGRLVARWWRVVVDGTATSSVAQPPGAPIRVTKTIPRRGR